MPISIGRLKYPISINNYSFSPTLLFAEAEKVGKTAFNPITAFKQSSLSDQSLERRGQDPKWKTLSKIGNRNIRLFLAAKYLEERVTIFTSKLESLCRVIGILSAVKNHPKVIDITSEK